MEISGWKSSRAGGTLGLRVGKDNATRFFDRKWRCVNLDLGGTVATVKITKRFWSSCPELRSASIGRFLERQGLAPWPKGRPPRMKLIPLVGNRFSVSLE